MTAIVVNNLSQLTHALTVEEQKLHAAVEQAITKAGLAVERQAKMNANTGTRQRVKTRNGYRVVPPTHIPGTGPGPNVVTGDLRRSINTEVRYGFGTYIAVVGASMIYARAVEMGLPNWNGKKYPYLGPAVQTLQQNGMLQTIFVRSLTKALS